MTILKIACLALVNVGLVNGYNEEEKKFTAPINFFSHLLLDKVMAMSHPYQQKQKLALTGLRALLYLLQLMQCISSNISIPLQLVLRVTVMRA